MIYWRETHVHVKIPKAALYLIGGVLTMWTCFMGYASQGYEPWNSDPTQKHLQPAPVPIYESFPRGIAAVGS